MASEQAIPTPEATMAGTFALRLKMPSDGILVLEDLPVSTTVKRLKEQIRDTMEERPSDEAQRLIHRGRLLTRDDETMLDLFGEEALRSEERQTLHLVIRDLSGAHQRIPSPFDRIPHPHPPPRIPPPHDLSFAQQLNGRHSTHLASIARANMAAGRQDVPTFTVQNGALLTLPQSTHHITHEGTGPDGQTWRLSLNRALLLPGTGGLVPPNPAAPPAGSTTSQVQSHTMHGGSAFRAIADALRRNDSIPLNQQLLPPSVTIPLIASRAGNPTGTPDPMRAAEHSSNTDEANSASSASSASSSPSPEVFILSSPSGPHAILINDDLSVYHSPQLHNHPPMGLPPAPLSPNVTGLEPPNARYGIPPQIIRRPTAVRGVAPATPQNHTSPGQHGQQGQPAYPQPQQGLQLPQPLPPHFGHGHGMYNAHVQAIRIPQIMPHVYMALRLALFIWLFTSPTSSWSRWITVVSVAIAFFVANTGVLNPYAEQIWGPLRRHVENWLPQAADPGQRGGGAANAQGGNADGPDQQRGGDAPDPAAAAARLVNQRRQDNADWLLNRVRRIERAGILFVASLAPGLAERHIAQVEAEARAERLRQQQEQEAATAARATSDAAAAAAAASASAASASAAEEEGNALSEENNEASVTNSTTSSSAARQGSPTPAAE